MGHYDLGKEVDEDIRAQDYDLLERAIAGAWHIRVPLGLILGINN